MTELLRFTTAGSVDDGKSTLIGRLLYDSKQTFEDQLASIERTSQARGDDYVDLALLTDGLRSEREQGITIDVAYRYFATPRRKFILADTPGHVQYTRNMVTGASTADLALILADARHGVVEQTRRHTYIASLLGISHFVLCVNKMDLVDYDETAFERVRAEFDAFTSQLAVADVRRPSALGTKGRQRRCAVGADAVVRGTDSARPLETVEVGSDYNLADGRFPVQYVIRPQSETHRDYRGYAGTVASGVFRPGDAVTVLPSGIATTVRSIEIAGEELAEAYPPMAVTLMLEDAIDVSRGDMICSQANPPSSGREIEAMVCWMTDESTLGPRTKLAIKHTTRSARAIVERVAYRLDVNTLACDEAAETLSLNEIGRVALRTSAPLFVDAYEQNRATGNFILIDEATNNTIGAGMVLAAAD